MNLIKIDKDNVANGNGIRQVLWFSSCEHHCLGCHNQSTWNSESGHKFTEVDEEYIFSICDNTYTRGITLTGGDPFHPNNRDELVDFVKKFKNKFPHQDIWCWTGYLFEEISSFELTKYIDIIVDGKFEIDKLSYTLPWRGSTNQRIVDVKQSLKSKHVISGGDELC